MSGKQISLIVTSVVVIAFAVASALLGIELETLIGAFQTTQGLSQ